MVWGSQLSHAYLTLLIGKYKSQNYFNLLTGISSFVMRFEETGPSTYLHPEKMSYCVDWEVFTIYLECDLFVPAIICLVHTLCSVQPKRLWLEHFFSHKKNLHDKDQFNNKPLFNIASLPLICSTLSIHFRVQSGTTLMCFLF